MLFKAALGLVAVAASVLADDRKDLGSVLAGNKDLSKFYDLIKKYPDILLQLPNYSGVTIAAPSNDAINNIPYTALNGLWDPENKDKTIPLLQYHILQGTVALASLTDGPTYFETTLLTSSAYTNVTTGQGVLINKQGENVIFSSGQGTRCTVVKSDIPFTGGLIQIVDNLLVPPTQVDKTAEAFQAKSFLGSLYAAKLLPDIAYRKNVTIFAPSDAAFKVVGGTLQGLNATQLARIMNYHIIPDQVLNSKSLINGTNFSTVAKDASGSPAQLTIRQDGNNKYANTAQIVQPDILLANGVMHVIGNVLNPDVEHIVPQPNIGTQPPVFAVSTASGAFTTALPCTTNCPVTTTSGDLAGATGTATTTTSSLFHSTSKGMGPRCTAHVAGAAMGMLGLGAGMALL
ncbi:hypothetical protein QQS21_010151 [Conoideocrella luteorostrata]|uniref:FAS1 domain-containing protein n=1 Tax=Conoideocrella luteorostrata TaxID=1105319 RepID=A0AAJ0CHW9_9HYPO|nr:hypothetical protein QQS21_010151 [Conoideocrella luteorostrata]